MSFHIKLNSLFINLPTIWHYTLWAIQRIIKYNIKKQLCFLKMLANTHYNKKDH